MKLYIKAMSKGKKDIEAKLDEVAYPLVQHLIKYFCYPDHDSSEHWLKEICSMLDHVSRFKGSNKLPSEEFIFHSLWEVSIENEFSTIYDNILFDYEYSNNDETNIRNKVLTYFKWISKELSNKGSLSKNEIKHHIKTIQET